MNQILSKGTLSNLPFEILTKYSLEDMFTYMVHNLSIGADVVMAKMELCQDDEAVMDVMKLINVVDLTRTQCEFVLGVLRSTSEKQVQELKNKYTLISARYEKINSKNDVAVESTRLCIFEFNNRIIVEFNNLVNQSFKANIYEDGFTKTVENMAQVKILTGRFNMWEEHFPIVITFPKDDIFCVEKSSPFWQNLHKSATFKSLITKKEARSSFKALDLILQICHIINKKHFQNKDQSMLETAVSLLQDVAYYSLQQAKAEIHALCHLTEPQVDAFQVFNLTDHPLVSKLIELRSPKICYDKVIYLPRLFPIITREAILKEYEDGTFNKITPFEDSQLELPSLGGTRSEVVKDLFVQTSDKVAVRILAPKPLTFEGPSQDDYTENLGSLPKYMERGNAKLNSSPDSDEAIVIHIHGGGFVSGSSAAYKVHLSRWVKNLKLTHFSIDYRLAPQNKYPDGLDDVWQAYLWIVNYAEAVLGIKSQKVILAGDSAGGNLVSALTLRLIKAGLRPPHGCLLVYPCLSIDGLSSSPSYFYSLDNTMLPYTLLKMIAKSYVDPEFKNLEDPFISPLAASDELLEKMPPVRIVSGDADIFSDDCWRLVAKLKKNNRNVHFTVHEHLSHGYLCHQDMTNYEQYVDETCDLIQELIEQKH